MSIPDQPLFEPPDTWIAQDGIVEAGVQRLGYYAKRLQILIEASSGRLSKRLFEGPNPQESKAAYPAVPGGPRCGMRA